VRVAANDPSQVVQDVRAIILLTERTGTRSMPIFVGMPEAATLAVPLAGSAFPRPSTADLAIELVRAAGGSIDRIAITRVNDKVLFAVVSINGEDVDARPSDAISLAVRVGAPILVDERVLDAQAVAGISVAEHVEAAAALLGDGIPAGTWKSLSLELLGAFLPPEAELSKP
jgi:bifunctional DNase/RNase